jgi:processing peptidase subunit alpha
MNTATQLRSFSATSSGVTDHSFSPNQYPLATEPPIVSSTTAAQAEEASDKTQSDRPISPTSATATTTPTQKNPFQSHSGDDNDNYDDGYSLSATERERSRLDQKTSLVTKLSGSTAITPSIPRSIPPNVPAAELETPETLLTVLSNGVRVVSQETYGQVSTVGMVSEMGSRLEKSASETGVTNLLEVLAFGATKQHSGMQVTELLQDWGGTRFVSTGREQTLHCIDLLRPNVDKAVDLLKQVLLEAQFLPEEVQEAKQALEYQAMDLPPELLLGEGLQTAAFGADQQLGQPHFCPADALPNLSADTVHDYWNRQFVQNPKGLVLAGAGVRHENFVEMAEQNFGHLIQVEDAEAGRTLVQPSVYRGGQSRLEQPPTVQSDGFIRVALGLHVGGWHSDDLVAACVLQTLLGGGNSFSAGGPGKGMYSRLYRQVLNRYGWAESAEAFTAFHGESGLWGISGSTVPHKARDMIQVFAEHLARLAVEPVTDEELDRARNMLKCNVLTQLESRLVLFEDLGRQVLTYGVREDMHTTCEKIDAVSKEDLTKLALQSLSQPPTLASVGHDLSHMPQQEEVAQWFR